TDDGSPAGSCPQVRRRRRILDERSGAMETKAIAAPVATGRLRRRRFLGGLAAGGAALMGSSALADSGGHPAGDAAILRLLADAEILETDAWQQYNELGGIQDAEVPGGSGSPDYTAALKVLDGDMDQYIHDNTEDEMTHELFINAFLVAH